MLTSKWTCRGLRINYWLSLGHTMLSKSFEASILEAIITLMTCSPGASSDYGGNSCYRVWLAGKHRWVDIGGFREMGSYLWDKLYWAFLTKAREREHCDRTEDFESNSHISISNTMCSNCGHSMVGVLRLPKQMYSAADFAALESHFHFDYTLCWVFLIS